MIWRVGGIDQAWLVHKGDWMATCLKPTSIGQSVMMMMMMMTVMMTMVNGH